MYKTVTMRPLLKKASIILVTAALIGRSIFPEYGSIIYGIVLTLLLTLIYFNIREWKKEGGIRVYSTKTILLYACLLLFVCWSIYRAESGQLILGWGLF